MAITNDPEEQQVLSRAFKPQQVLVGVLRRLKILREKPEQKPFDHVLRIFKDWIIVPYSRWFNDIGGLNRHVCKELEEGRPLDGDLIFLAELMADIPNQAEQDAIAEYEFDVRAGKYDSLVDDSVKLGADEKQLTENANFQRHLQWFIKRFNLDKRATINGIIKRSPVGEDNHRGPKFKFDISTEKLRFQLLWDAFCWRHQLYGFDLNIMKPLVMKIKITITGYSTVISIPRRRSCDFIRDLKLTAISILHKAGWSQGRQGPKLSEGMLEKKELARRIYEIDLVAKQMELEGKRRWEFIIEEAGLAPNTDPRAIQKLIQFWRDHLAGNPPAENTPKQEVKPEQDPVVRHLLRCIPKLTPEQLEVVQKAMAAQAGNSAI